MPTDVNCTLGTLSVAGYGVEIPTDVNTTLGTLSVAGYNVQFPTAIDCTLGTLSVVGYNATIDLGADVDINCTLGTLSVAGYNAEFPTAIDCTLGTLSVTGYNATVATHLLRQQSFRWRYDDGDETAAAWRAAVNVDPATILPDVVYRMRVLIQEYGGAAGAPNDTFNLWFRINAGTWTPVATAGNAVRRGGSQLVDGNDTTQQIGSGTFVSNNDGQSDNTSVTCPTAIGANEEIEVEFSFFVRYEQISDSDVVEFRVQHTGGADYLDDYVNTSSVTIDKPAYQRLEQKAYRFRDDDGTEVTASWLAALDTEIAMASDTTFRLRYVIEEEYGEDWYLTASGPNGMRFSWWFRINGGSWTLMSGTTPVGFDNTSQLVNGGDTTQQLGSGSFLADNNGQYESQWRNQPDCPGSSEYEIEVALNIDSTQTDPGDYIEVECHWRPGSNSNKAMEQTVAAAKFWVDEIWATLGTLTVAGQNATVEVGTSIDCTLGTLSVAGYNAGIETSVNATTGTLTVAGNNATIATHMLRQQSFRWRYDDDDETAAAWRAAVNLDPVDIFEDVIYRIRFLIQEYGGAAGPTGETFDLYFRRNGGTWKLVGSDGYMQTGASCRLINGNDTTQQIGAGTFVSNNDGQCEDAQMSCPAAIGADEEVELEYSFLPTTAWDDGDTIDLRVQHNGGGLLDSYVNTPGTSIDDPGYTRWAVTKFRLRWDDGNEAAATWIKPADVNWSVPSDTTIRMRFLWKEKFGEDHSDVGHTGGSYIFNYRKNGGTWSLVSSSSSNVKLVASQLVEGNDTTQQIGSGSFTTDNDGQWGTGTYRDVRGHLGSSEQEWEFAFQVIAADTTPGDTIEFQVGYKFCNETAFWAKDMEPTLLLTVDEVWATTGAITVAGQNPILNLETGINVTLGTLAVAGYNATIETGLVIDCTLGTLSVAGYNATIETGQVIDCTLGTLSVAGYNVEIPTDVNATLGTLSVAGYDVEMPWDVNASLGTLSVAGLNPFVQADAEVQATLGTLSVAGYDVEMPWDVNASLGTLTLAGYNATIEVGQIIDCTLGTLTVAGYKAEMPWDLNATLGTLSVAGYDVEIPTDIAVSLGTLTVAGYNAGIETSINCTLGTLSVAGLNPFVQADIDLQPGTGALTVTGYNADIEIGQIIDCTLGTLSVTGYKAEMPWDVNASLGTLTLAGLNVTISLGQIIDCTLGTLTLAGFDPFVQADTDVQATAGALTVAGANPFVQTDSLVSATAGALTLAGLDANVVPEIGILAATGAVTVAGFDATIETGLGVQINATLGAVALGGLNTEIVHAIEYDKLGAIPDPPISQLGASIDWDDIETEFAEDAEGS
jgi:hypothetical protein